MLTGGGISNLICSSFYIKGEIYNAPLWFLIVLFEIYMISYYTKAISDRTINRAAICLGCLISGFLLYHCELRVFDWLGLNRTIVMLGFFSLGALLSNIRMEKMNQTALISIGALSLSLWLLAGLYNSKVSVYGFNFGVYPIFLLSAIGGSVFIAILCFFLLNKKNFLTELSSYAILFLGTQFLWIKPFGALAYRLHFSTAAYYILASFLTAAYIILLPILYRHLVLLFPKLKILNGEN